MFSLIRPHAEIVWTVSKEMCKRNIWPGLFQHNRSFTSGTKADGYDNLLDNTRNKDLAYTLEERQLLGIHGLQPPCVRTQEEQVIFCGIQLDRFKEKLNKYIYLTELADRNQRLFYKLLAENIDQLMPIVYTPTVGEACLNFSLIYRRPRGLFITIYDKGNIYKMLNNWPYQKITTIVVTDGERILGLGDLGANGMGIPIGKLALYTALAGIHPSECLPVTLDVGTNNKALLEDPIYVGLRIKRVTGQCYDEFIEEFMQAVVKRFGQRTLIQFEDFGNANAFRLLQKYRQSYCTFNDDIQGTASVALAGLRASERITGVKIKDQKLVFLGAGEAAVGIADLVVSAMVNDGLSLEEARSRIWMCDIHGLLALGRPEGGIDDHQIVYAKKHNPEKTLAAIVNEVKPTGLIGASTAGGAFTPEILKAMATFNKRPVIFALSNPTSKAECTAEQAYTHTEGRAVFASGSPFQGVKVGDKTFTPGQGNNAYIYPGVGLGVLLAGINHIEDDIFLIAAQCLADNVSDADLEVGRLYPPVKSIREISVQIACRILHHAYEKCIATLYPEPKDMRKYVESHQYNFNYTPAFPKTWCWPEFPIIKLTEAIRKLIGETREIKKIH